MKTKKITEDQFLAEAVKEIWNTMPETRYCFFHIASEAKRTVMEWAQLKAKGFIAGIQDLQFVFKGTVYHIELKTEIGVISPEQAVVHCAHFNQGFPTYIFRDSESLVMFVRDVVSMDEKDVRSKYSYAHSPYCIDVSNLPRLIEVAKSKKRRKR